MIKNILVLSLLMAVFVISGCGNRAEGSLDSTKIASDIASCKKFCESYHTSCLGCVKQDTASCVNFVASGGLSVHDFGAITGANICIKMNSICLKSCVSSNGKKINPYPFFK